MPLLDKDTVECLVCGIEQAVGIQDWTLPEGDDCVFWSPPCPGCGATETFCYHDDVDMKLVIEVRPFPPEVEGGPERSVRVAWLEPDPEGYEAKHMELISEVATTLGVNQKELKPPEKPDYPSKPKKPQRSEMKAAVKVKRERLLGKPLKTKDIVDAGFQGAVTEATEHAKQRKAEKEAIREEKRKSKYKGPQEEILPPGQMKKEDEEPKVDKPSKKAFPKSEQPKVKGD